MISVKAINWHIRRSVVQLTFTKSMFLNISMLAHFKEYNSANCQKHSILNFNTVHGKILFTLN